MIKKIVSLSILFLTLSTQAVADDRRVAIIADASLHLGPELALILADRGHDIVLTQPREGLVDELEKKGAKVINVEGIDNINDKGAVSKLVKAADANFGGFDSAFIRPGLHVTGNIFEVTDKEFEDAFKGNMLSVSHALKALLTDLEDKGRVGQILIETSASAQRPMPFAVAYGSTRAGANMIIQDAAYTVAREGITVNAMGTNFMNYPGFRESVGADDPEIFEKVLSQIPVHRLGEPKEAAHLAASLLDGNNMYTTGQVFSVSGGWAAQ